VSIRSRLAGWIGGKRRAVPAVDFQIPTALFGGIATNQPSHETLLRESMGVADMATRAIANRISGLEPQVKVKVRESEGTETEEILDDHPLKMLLDRPHPNFSKSQVLRLTAQYIVTVGEAYWLKVGNRLAIPAELHVIPPDRVTPIVNQNVVTSYAVQEGSGQTISYPADAIVRFFFPDPENMWASEGYLGPAGVTADSLKFSGEHLRRQYQTDATPKTVLEAGPDAIPFQPGEAERFWDLWSNRFNTRTGTKVGSPGITPAGYKLIQIALSSGADITPLLTHWRDEQLMGFFTPRSVLGQVVSGDRSSAETNQYVFDRYGVLPIATLIAESLTLQLAPDFDAALFVDWEAFISQDKEFELKQEGNDLSLKVRSVNQVREDRGLDPVDWGDDPVGSFQDKPYMPDEFDEGFDDADPFGGGSEEEDDEEPDEEERTRGRLVANEWMRQVRREKEYVPLMFQAMRNIFSDQWASIALQLEMQRARIKVSDIFNPEEWASLFRIRVEPVRETSFINIAQETLASLESGDFIFTEQMRDVLRRQGAELVTHVNKTTERKLRRILEAGTASGASIDQISKRIRSEMVGNIGRARARTIARTEVLKASQTAQVESFRQAGVDRKQWNHSQDPENPNHRPEHLAIDGQIRSTKEAFNVAGEPMMAPGLGSAENSINCRCFVTPVLA
jgi:SPP1 gp7 family putative phage head morphogenesis protein